MRQRVPAPTVNFCGQEHVSIEEWTAILSELTGLEPRLKETGKTIGSVTLDLSHMKQALGETSVPLRDGLERMVRALNPELLLS